MCITMSRRTTLVLWLGCLAACLAVCAEGVQISHQSVRCTTTLSATPLLRRSWNLELRGGDDEEEGGAEAEAEGGAKGEEEEEDEDAGPMTINKALKQVLHAHGKPGPATFRQTHSNASFLQFESLNFALILEHLRTYL